jgi:aspartate kinase
MKIMKFGGASVRDGAAIRNVARIVKSHVAEEPIVVTSAMSGVTDAIERHIERVRDEAEVPILIDALREKHLTACREAVQDPHTRKGAIYTVDKVLERLERLLFGIAYTEELTPKAQDFALSFGERLAAPVVAATLTDHGLEARSFDAEHAHILTDGTYGNANPDLDAIEREYPSSIGAYVESGGVPVVTGFYGVDDRGHATVFGRGGSDYVAAILAYAGNAEVLEIWKDVAGFMTTDPDIVPEARPLPLLSYDEAAELANFGAKVLHPRTVEPVSRKHIPIRVRNARDPEYPGTLIQELEEDEPVVLRAVACRGNLAIVKLIGPGMAYTKGIGLRTFNALTQSGVNVINMAASHASFALLINGDDTDRAVQALQQIKGGVIQGVEALPDMALICVVGKGLAETPGSAASILGAISHAGVNIEMISLGASNIAIDVIVRGQDKEAAVRAVHEAFLKDGERKEGFPKMPQPTGAGVREGA